MDINTDVNYNYLIHFELIVFETSIVASLITLIYLRWLFLNVAVADRVILYVEQYSSFIKTHINSTLIQAALLAGRPYLNVPQYPLIDRDIAFQLYTKQVYPISFIIKK